LIPDFDFFLERVDHPNIRVDLDGIECTEGVTAVSQSAAHVTAEPTTP